ncbi:MAG: 16S rRNA (guanine(966)-N(2))-methyltransferase RsmD [Alphaproteobacteria bacterium]|nr:16S rRNA (guanine(966)-N(2))-methyltransferase RsmD [Alphaproteobacteria bacterium]
MKIVAGAFGGRKLVVPKNRDIRPTSDKIRGAIFNMLASRDAIESANVLDAFCGTGALGLEALSRGATRCTFMDKSIESLNLAKENVRVLGVENQCNFLLTDATKMKSTDKQFDLVFIDPPYFQNLVTFALENFASQNILTENAWCVCETEKRAEICIESFEIDHEKVHGDTKITLLKYQPITPP